MHALQIESKDSNPRRTAGTIRIVVLDDHPIVREGLSALINAQPGYEVVAQCGDAFTGKAAIQTHEPDIVISDIMMPGNSVFEMAKFAIKSFPHLRFIFLSGFISDKNIEKALRLGVYGIICKSNNASEVLEAINAVSRGQKYFSRDAHARIVQSRHSDNQVCSRFTLLSHREIQVLTYIGNGCFSKEIALALGISIKTVERHKSNLMSKLDLNSQVELVRYAIREGVASV